MERELRETFDVADAEAGRRLDAFLAERLGLSRAASRRLLARGRVQVGERVVDAAAKGMPLRAGDRVEVVGARRPEEERTVAEPEQPLAVLAEGPGWLVADKPAGVAVHPLVPEERGTLLGAVAARHPELHGVGEGGLRSGVVHRLDVDTSGALLLATEAQTWQRLRTAFRERRVEKRYRAIARGALDAERGEARLPLVVARHRPAYVRAAKPSERDAARECTTRWQVLERLCGAMLVELTTEGGFLHQVRATLAQLGHPLVGDRTYGSEDDAPEAPRHMLHASSLRFEEIAAESPDPADFRAVLDALR